MTLEIVEADPSIKAFIPLHALQVGLLFSQMLCFFNAPGAARFSSPGVQVAAVPFLSARVTQLCVPMALQGESASGGSKGAVASTGLQVKVPVYINKGDRVVIDTATGQFIRRA